MAQGTQIYAARVGKTDIYRIGVSKTLPARLQVLRKHSPKPVSIAHSLSLPIDGDGEIVLEELRALLGRLGTHLRGDWYRVEEEVMGTAFIGLLFD